MPTNAQQQKLWIELDMGPISSNQQVLTECNIWEASTEERRGVESDSVR